ncbi:hypothetical protein Tco_0366892 [Tanacetum coccineum]
MAISVILISSDSSDESVDTTIPPIVPTIPYTSPFMYTDSSDNDSSDTPSSPIHNSPPTRQILPALPGARHRRAILISPDQKIPFGRSYRTHPNGSSSSDCFTSNDSSPDSASDSASGYSSDTSSSHSTPDSPFDSPADISARPSRKRCRSPTTSVPTASPVPGELSLVCTDLLPPRKRTRGSDSATDFEADIDACIATADVVAARETDDRVDVGIEAKEEADSSTRDTVEIEIDPRIGPVVTDDVYEPTRQDFPDLVSADRSLEIMQRGLDVVMQELYDHMLKILVHRVRVIESVQRDQGHRMMATSQQSVAMSERIGTFKRENVRLRVRYNFSESNTQYGVFNFLDTAYKFCQTNTAYSTPSSIRRIEFTEYDILSYLIDFFPSEFITAIVLNDALTYEITLTYEPTVSSLNDNEIDFRISFDESDDEDYTPTVSYFDDLDYFKDFEKEFPAIVYNDALASKLDFLTKPTVSPQHIDEFNLKDETSLSECDDEEQNVLYFNDLFPFNVIYLDDSKSDEDNDDDKIDIEHSSGDLSVKPLPDVINTDDGAYVHGSK